MFCLFHVHLTLTIPQQIQKKNIAGTQAYACTSYSTQVSSCIYSSSALYIAHRYNHIYTVYIPKKKKVKPNVEN